MDDAQYAARLTSLQNTWWKQLLRVQIPYHAHVRKLCLGATLDVGCGIGRNLSVLPVCSVGVDTNAVAVQEARSLGMAAITAEEFSSAAGDQPRFNTILLSHVLEHMTRQEAVRLLEEYLPHLLPGGVVVSFCPQKAGYKSDDTHVEFIDFHRSPDIFAEVGLSMERQYSFPLPRFTGGFFKYNEFVSIGRKAALPQ